MQTAKREVDTFNVRVRHGGTGAGLGHEIPKAGITLKEIVLLRAIHGQDALPDANIKKVGTKEIDEQTELFELARTYANTADPTSGRKIVEKTFSTALVGFDEWLAESLELAEMEREEADKKRRTADAAARQEAFRAEIRAAAGQGVPAA